ncbi:DUF333 domain-containing protein [Erwinia sp. E_sp_B04_7]|uniref:putative hemolysin n=1 Tax=unclassified Erwinia TaxID=2622719 RepID=UPI0030CC4B00
MKTVSLIIAAATLTACSHQPAQRPQTAGMANPASVYCLQQQGSLQFVQEQKGTVGYCTLPSGEKIEEWTLYRQNHK